MKPLILLTFLFSVACATGDEGLSSGEILTQARVVLGEASDEPESEMDPDEARRRLDAARDAFLREEYRACLAMIRETIEMKPPDDVEAELKQIRYEAKRRLLSRQILVVKALPVRDVYVTGNTVEIELALRNVTDGAVRVPLSTGDSSPSLFFLEVEWQYWDIFGNVRSESERIRFPVEEELEVPVGGRRTLTWRTETVEPGRRHLGFTQIRISGTFRPAVLYVGEEEFHSGLPVKEALVRVVPPGYEPIAADPLGTLTKAYRLGAREHLLVAAELVPPERRREAVGTLVGLLGDEVTPTAITAMTALNRLTGRNLGQKPAAWKSWWKEERADGLD